MSVDDVAPKERDYLLSEFRFGALALQGVCISLPEGSPTADDLEVIVARLNTAIHMVKSGELREALKAMKVQTTCELLH